MDERAVVTVFLRNRGEILLLRRSDEVGSYRGMWGAVAGHAEGDPESAVRTEIREETGIDPEGCALASRGDPFEVEDADLDRRWIVHPFLFDCPTRSVTLDWEHTDAEWASPTEILRRQTVPRLWRSYDGVRPTVETVRSDSDHGSAYISLRALEVLRDEAATLAMGRDCNFDSVAAVAAALLDARPAMAVVANRIHRVMDGADSDPATVETLASEEIERAGSADRRTATALQEFTDGAAVATLSRSGTVLEALRSGAPASVLIAESRPGREGIGVAESLAEGTEVTLTSDAALPQVLATLDSGRLVVGADSILPDGSVVNKVGTRAAATVAQRTGTDVVVAAATDKVRPDESFDLEPREPSELYDGPAPVTVENPTFDVTPSDAVDSYVTEEGELTAAEIEGIAAAHERRRGWRDQTSE
jgi:translation initiation factor 2B subunit (eIF-2B alpha/beta/delta family)